MLSSSFRSFSFSLPSSEVQSPSSRSCTFRVGSDVIGTSYWQALKARRQRQIVTPSPRSKTKFGEVTDSRSPLGIDLHRNRLGQECTECRCDRRFPSLFFVVRA